MDNRRKVINTLICADILEELIEKTKESIDETYTKEECYRDILSNAEFNWKIVAQFIDNKLNTSDRENIINNLHLMPSYLLAKLISYSENTKKCVSDNFDKILKNSDEMFKAEIIEEFCFSEEGIQFTIEKIENGIIKQLGTRSRYKLLRVLGEIENGKQLAERKFEDFFEDEYDMIIVEELLKIGIPEQKIIDNKSEILKKSYGNNIISFIEWFEKRAIFQEGDISLKEFVKLLYSNINDEKTIEMLEIFFKELLAAQKLSITDIKELGQGKFSKAYRIGNFVLKTGENRLTEEIPYHRRILQPLVRQQSNPRPKENEDNIYIEIQNVVDTGWYMEMSTSRVKEELYKIYKEMRKSGIIWTDIKASNVGRLILPNKTNYMSKTSRTIGDRLEIFEEELEVSDESTGMTNRKNERCLQPGELVILDTDFIFKAGDINIEEDLQSEDPPIYIFYEEIYNKELEENERE